MKFRDNLRGFIDLGSVVVIGAAFVALMFVGYLIFKLKDLLLPTAYGTGQGTDAANDTWNTSYYNSTQSIGNITKGFDQAVNFLVIAVIISIAAIAIAALFFMRGKSE
jgi:large-conductance mechanosensitive channel